MPTENNRNDVYIKTNCHSCNKYTSCARYDIEFMDVPRFGIYDNPISESPMLCDPCMDMLLLNPIRKMGALDA